MNSEEDGNRAGEIIRRGWWGESTRKRIKAPTKRTIPGYRRIHSAALPSRLKEWKRFIKRAEKWEKNIEIEE
jgi:hypothetical protein